jgi:hypothetical protein
LRRWALCGVIKARNGTRPVAVEEQPGVYQGQTAPGADEKGRTILGPAAGTSRNAEQDSEAWGEPD